MVSQDSISYGPIKISYTDSLLSEITYTETEIPLRIQLKSIKKEDFVPDWTVALFISIFIILAWIRVAYEKYLYSMLQSSFNVQTANRLFRERVNSNIYPALGLDIIFYITIGFLAYHIEQNYIEELRFNSFVHLLINITAIFIFINGKLLTYRFLSILFKCQTETNEFIFYLKSNNRILGIFMLPFTIIMFFSEGILLNIYMILSFLLTLFFSASSLFRGFVIITKKDFSIYYLILYLCSLEILPLLIAWRILW